MTDTTEEEIKKEIDSLITCPYCRKILEIYEYDKCRCINPNCKLRKDYAVPIYDYGFYNGKLEGYKLGKQQARKEIIEIIEKFVTDGKTNWTGWQILRLEGLIKQIESGDKI